MGQKSVALEVAIKVERNLTTAEMKVPSHSKNDERKMTLIVAGFVATHRNNEQIWIV